MSDNNKLSLDMILNEIKQKLNERKITNGKVEVVLSWYRHAKDRVDFELIESTHIVTPLIKQKGMFTFYIYDDFYSPKNTKYKFYESFVINTHNKTDNGTHDSSYRICYKVMRGKKECLKKN
jgi:hypothetical protein